VLKENCSSFYDPFLFVREFVIYGMIDPHQHASPYMQAATGPCELSLEMLSFDSDTERQSMDNLIKEAKRSLRWTTALQYPCLPHNQAQREATGKILSVKLQIFVSPRPFLK
jgi:hypothetical protein